MHFGIGVIGATGFIGTPYRQEIREATADARIIALCARRQDLLEQAGEQDNAMLITNDWREVIHHPEVNLVLICTPDALHHEALLSCAKAGKHVFCEKPIGTNVQQAFEMYTAVEQAGLAHYVPFWSRYQRVLQQAKQILTSGRLGDIRGVVYRWHNPRPLGMPFTWRDDAALSSAGSIADVGSHAYDTMRWLLGAEATRVMAHADVITAAKPDLGDINLTEAIDWGASPPAEPGGKTRQATAFDYASLAFEFATGAVGTLILSHSPYFRKGLAPDLELHGTEASLAVNRTDSTTTFCLPDQPPEAPQKVEEPDTENRFINYVFPALREIITHGTTAHPGMDDGYRVQLFTDACSRSASEKSWIELNQIDPDPAKPSNGIPGK